MDENFLIVAWGVVGALVAVVFDYLEQTRQGLLFDQWRKENARPGALIAHVARLGIGGLAAWVYVTQITDTLAALAVGFAGVLYLQKLLRALR